ncbi:hypothetical protein EDE05_1308 [Neorhizobium sp. R1-B]|jgi:hypothetical protein|uniref:hypothetical protein n=1 Tax=Neorhizobium TaxID=1525371 RepID=UPI000CFA4AC2|nr:MULTISPECIES: hypothetical protein [Neorhizobium]TCV74757.1 hypothetical protein EDE09_102516 [Neorhizobium sp. S3-V5DH]TDX71734.1 hypothetical protein EDE05_1308 [Neorhizobium sp. R1-B]
MTELEVKVRELFNDYGRVSNEALADPTSVDVGRVAAFFAPYFVGSAPQGVMGGANDERFREVIPQGFAHYREVGGKEMLLTGLRVTPLNDLHALAEVGWEFVYVNRAGENGRICFTNFYFVTVADGDARIFAYVTGDEEKAMKEHGLA